MRGEARNTTEAQLSAGQAWSAAARAGARLHCAEGALWVTLEGDAADYVLRQGEAFTSDRDGLLVAQALGDESASLAFCTSPTIPKPSPLSPVAGWMRPEF